MNELDEKIKLLAKWIYNSKHLIAFTGAGISTESGLSDFRGPDGVWTRRDKGLPAKKLIKPMSAFEPNIGHYALVKLQELGYLKFIISQNVDNLHLKSGIKEELLAELHGNTTKLRCIKCARQYDKSSKLIICPECKGQLKSSIVNFGDSLPIKELELSYKHSEKADVFLILGSSLLVTPAADMPRIALDNDAKVILINKGETPFDNIVSIRIWESIGEVLNASIMELEKLIDENMDK